MEITETHHPHAGDKTPETAGQAGGQRAMTVDVGGDEGAEDLDSEACRATSEGEFCSAVSPSHQSLT